MNNELKEILEFKENADYKRLSCDEIAILKDYITNLQQLNLSLAKENEQEKQFIKDCGIENVQQLVLDYIGIRQEKEDYKSRIEKAVEELELWQPKIEIIKLEKEYLLNILNGRSEKE